MRSKSTTGQGKEHELHVEGVFEWDNARRSRSSGASFHDPVDITSDSMVIECESTEAKSYRLTLDFWNEVVQKQHTGKIPALAVRFRDPTSNKRVDLMVVELENYAAEREELEAYRTEALKRD
jgi:hypothetical protein